MDELFIRMCQEARELQEQWEAKPGDRAKYPGYQVQFLDRGHMDYYNFESLIWLPRQEDLQQIFRLKNGNPDDYWILKSFLVWFSDLNFCHYRDVSINKLWLRYVMEFVYKKRWNGTTWEPLK